jgi:hypothetical protein
MEERRQAIETYRETGEMPESGSKLFKGSGFSSSDESKQLRIEDKALRENEIKLEEKIEYAAENGPVADGSFKKTQEWVGLAVKRLLREASEGGYDGVAFTTGDSVHKLMGGELEGQRKFYDEILPSIVKKESKSKLSTTTFPSLEGRGPDRAFATPEGLDVEETRVKMDKAVKFNFLELTPKVKARGMKPQKLFEVLIGASAIPAAAALMGEEEEELKRADQ